MKKEVKRNQGIYYGPKVRNKKIINSWAIILLVLLKIE
jgi:hypothetical protein